MSEAIVTQAAFIAALARASDIELSAYVLESRSPVVRALEAAADRGASVSLVLEADPYLGRSPSDDPAARTRQIAASLESHGVRVAWTTPSLPVHMKAAIVDHTAFLDDRNWPTDAQDTIVATTDPDDVSATQSALAGKPASDGHLATEKRAALALEARTIRFGTGDHIDIESESFGYSAVSKALAARAQTGAHVRLLVAKREFDEGSPTERASLRRLQRAGVDVRIVVNDEKLAIAGDRAWTGSANATWSPGPMLDWGMSTRRPELIAGIEAAFERNWQAAVPAHPRAKRVEAPV
jgi:hypothetical protein